MALDLSLTKRGQQLFSALMANGFAPGAIVRFRQHGPEMENRNTPDSVAERGEFVVSGTIGCRPAAQAGLVRS
jgi:hypothetical protein